VSRTARVEWIMAEMKVFVELDFDGTG